MKKTFLLSFIIALLAAGALFPSGKKERTKVEDTQTVAIAFTANERGRHAASQTGEPAAAYAAVIDGLRKEYGNALLLSLGNFLGPTPSTIVSRGRLDFQLLERMGYQLIHLSNHEFVIDEQPLMQRIKETRVPVLSGNLGLPGSNAKRSVMLKSGNRTVGFIGLTSQSFVGMVHENLRKTTQLESFSSYVESALKELKGRADIVVALTDLSESELKEARTIEGIDLLISSGEGESGQAGEWISVAQPGTGGAIIARALPSPAVNVLELKLARVKNRWIIDSIDGDVYPVTRQTPQNRQLEQWVAGQINAIRSSEAEELGTLKAQIKNDKALEQQSELGTAVTNAMRSLTGAHVAAINAGGLQNGLPKGTVTSWDFIAAMPYPSFIVVKKLSGAQLEQVLEKSRAQAGKNGFLHWSGLETEPAALGTRVCGAKIIPEKNYNIAVIDFLAQGGEGYAELKEAATVGKHALTVQDLCQQIFTKYGTLVPPDLPLYNELNYWFGKLSIKGSVMAIVSDPDNALNYPDQSSFISQQYINTKGEARLDLGRKDFFFGLDNFVETQYGMNWDKDLKQHKALDLIRTGSQLTLYLTNFLFAGELSLDPYVSGVFETVMQFPDPYLENPDPEAIRPGSLQFAGGVETNLLWIFTLKLGFRWQTQPYDPAAKPQTGLEGILSFKLEPLPGILSFNSSTQAFSSFNWQEVGVNVSSEDSLMLQLGQNLKVGPTARFFYNTLVGKWAYLMDTTLELQFQL